MSKLKLAAGLVLGLIPVLAMSAPASAATITFGTDTGRNAFPFMFDWSFVPNFSGHYQQVYDGSLFSGPVSITDITFFSSPVAPGTITGDYTLSLSTTSATVLGISPVFTNNIGADNAQFFSGAVSNVLSFGGTPFLFDPSAGNLLLDVIVNTSNGVPIGSITDFLAASCITQTNRLYNFQGGNNVGLAIGPNACTPNSYGLKTQFTFTAAEVPEPSELAMFGTGLLGLLGLGAARRRRTALT